MSLAQSIESFSDNRDLTLDATLHAPSGTGDVNLAAGWALRLPDWSRDHYLLAPAAVYAGNRFPVFKLPYAPYLPPEAEQKRLPITVTDVVRLHLDGSPGLIQLLTGHLALPALAVWSPDRREAIFLLVDEPFGAHGAETLFEVEEGPDAAWCELRVCLPGVRATRYVHMSTGNESPDRGRPLAPGESLRIQARLLVRPCENIEAFLAAFAGLRDAYAEHRPPVRPGVPFAEAFRVIEEKFNTTGWREDLGLYSLDPRRDNPYAYTAGWSGVPSFPLALTDDAASRARARRTLGTLLGPGVSPSGFFYGKRDQTGTWCADHGVAPAKPHLAHRLLARRNGDSLYYLLKQRALLDSADVTPPVSAEESAAWDRGLRAVADAFVRLWEREGQFGYLLHQQTGELICGGSASAASAPAALALAYQRYRDPRHLAVAEAAARAFARDFLEKGYTAGAPGEALLCADSESAAGLVESYATLHDITGSPEWLRWGRLAADLLSTWTQAFDWPFPPQSEFGRLGLQSRGGVFANTQNAHNAPGICTHAGLGLLRLFRATGETRHLRLVRDIARALPQFVSRPDRPVHAGRIHDIAAGRGRPLPPGWINERLNTNDWDNNVGGVFYGSCWCEVSLLYTVVELPGIYAATDSDLLAVLDHVEAARLPDGRLRIHNPTTYLADVRLLAESAAERALPLPLNPGAHYRRVRLAPGETQIIPL